MKKILIVTLSIITGFSACKKEENPIYTVTGVQPAETFIDHRDGKEYACIEIGDQIWMAENLAYIIPEPEIFGCRTFNEEYLSAKNITSRAGQQFIDSMNAAFGRNEIADPEGLEDSEKPSTKIANWTRAGNTFEEMNTQAEADQTFSPAIIQVMKRNQTIILLQVSQEHKKEADEANGNYSQQYGLLYSYEAALKAVPQEGGWRIPTDADWLKLEKQLGMSQEELNKKNEWRGDIQGIFLKEGEQGIGFNARFGGGKLYTPKYDSNSDNETFTRKGQNAYFWTAEKISEPDTTSLGMIRSVALFNDQILRTNTFLKNEDGHPVLFSVRLVKDKE